MKIVIAALLSVLCLEVNAQEKVIRLYPGAAPGSEKWKQKEKVSETNTWHTKVIYNVVDPALIVVPADPALATGSAIVICPGGGFQALSIESEGLAAARWLAAKGITCFVLKYRVVESKTDEPTKELSDKSALKMEEDVKPIIHLAMEDALAAMTYVRTNAKEFGINPHKIGIMGFSAGGTVATSVAYNYTAVSRPDFIAPIYLEYDWVPRRNVLPDAPPAFILAASDDHLGLATQSIHLYLDWLASRQPTELHMLAKGGHGFGMTKQGLPSDNWIELLFDWLVGIGMAKK